jgi:membrane protein DedA with SNARE-associated domain
VVPDASLALVQDLIDWLRPLFENVGYVVVTVAMFLESAAFTGVVVPGDIILAMGGVYASSGSLSLPFVIVCGVLAALAGQTVGYLLGRHYGRRLLAKLPFLRRFEDRLDRVAKTIERRGGTAIVLGRFATGVAGLVPFVAGTSGVRWRTFLLFAIPTTTAWAVAVVVLGYMVGNNVELIDRILSTVGWVGLAVIASALVAWWAYRRWRGHARTAS